MGYRKRNGNAVASPLPGEGSMGGENTLPPADTIAMVSLNTTPNAASTTDPSADSQATVETTNGTNTDATTPKPLQAPRTSTENDSSMVESLLQYARRIYLL